VGEERGVKGGVAVDASSGMTGMAGMVIERDIGFGFCCGGEENLSLEVR
jgi:hypothetical protein